MGSARAGASRRIAAENRKARFSYAIEETLEAGLMLGGTEVKALRAGRANIVDAYASPERGEIFLVNAYIPEYEQAGRFFQHEPRRPRKLLLHRREVARLASLASEKGMTLVPLQIYFNERGIAKVELAVARGKKLHDKRATDKARDWARERSRLLRDKG